MGKFPPLPPEKQSKPYEPFTGAPGHDGMPPSFEPRRILIWEDGKRVAEMSPFNVNHSVICWLHSRKRIEDRQFLAAEKLAMDWQKAEISPRASSVMVGAGSTGGENLPNDTKVAAMKRHKEAATALGRSWPLVELVVECNMSVEKAAACLRVHTKYAHGQLNAALHFLADHYGLS